MRYCILFLILILSNSALADGEGYSGSTFPPPSRAIFLCNSKTATGSCNGGVGISSPTGYKWGPVEFEIAKSTGCSACTVNINVGSGTGTLNLIKTLECTGTTAHTLQAGLGLAGKLFVDVSLATGCTDLDVVGHFGIGD